MRLTRREKEYIKNTVIGVLTIIMAFMTIPACDNDATACLMMCLFSIPYTYLNIRCFFESRIERKERRRRLRIRGLA